MPDFTARITVPIGNLTFRDTFNVPARINPLPGVDPRYVKVAKASTSMQAKATVSGTEGPLDSALGGRLFKWWWAQWPGYPAVAKSLPTITTPRGQSSVADVTSFPNNDSDRNGLWLLMCWREGGGGVMLPFNVET